MPNTDMMDVLGDLLIDLEKSAASSPTPNPKEQRRLQNNMGLLTTVGGMNYANSNKGLLTVPGVEPPFLYTPDRDIITGLPIVNTPSPSPLSPRVLVPAGGRTSALSNHEAELPTPSVNDSHEDFKFQSYHLDYKFTPPPIKGPCCVCGDGILGAMVTALDKMWHPMCFTCANCSIELRPPMFIDHDEKPYCKACYGKLFLPPCAGCGNEIAGNYIKAMGSVWHPTCFQCTRCRKVLTPTTFFQKEGKPYCEDDYHDLFSPKCYQCKKPIKDDRKIAVQGRNYHPSCFKCCECGTQLGPTNFKERNGKLYCDHDYHKLFSPKCGVCSQPIKDDRKISAMGRDYHETCFKCCECAIPLTPNNFKERDGKLYCINDYNDKFMPKCGGCNTPVVSNGVTAMGKTFHPQCFQCTECKRQLNPDRFFEKNGRPYCEDDFHKLFSPKCFGCSKPIKDQSRMTTAMGRTYHPEHFNCTECGKILTPNNYFEMNGQPYCEDDYHRLFSKKCAACLQPIKDPKDMVTAMGNTYHKDHFNCTECGKILSPQNYFEMDGLPYCEEDFHRLFSKKCGACGQYIKDNRYIFAMDQFFHPEHFTCHQCGKQLKENDFYEKDGRVYCLDDFLELFAPRCIACRKPIKEEYCLYALNGDWHANCFRCKDCNCLLEERNFYEIDGYPYCEEHFHARQCPDCIKMRRAQNKYFGLNPDTPMGPSRWASQVSLKEMLEETTSVTNGRPVSPNGTLLGTRPVSPNGRPSSQLSQFSVNSYDTAYTNDGRTSPSMRSYIIPIEREGESRYRKSLTSSNNAHTHHHHHHHEGCNHEHNNQKSNMRRGQSQNEVNASSGNLGKWSGSQNNLQYIARNENPYNYLEPGKFPVESKHIRFADTVTQREYETDAKYH